MAISVSTSENPDCSLARILVAGIALAKNGGEIARASATILAYPREKDIDFDQVVIGGETNVGCVCRGAVWVGGIALPLIVVRCRCSAGCELITTDGDLFGHRTNRSFRNRADRRCSGNGGLDQVGQHVTGV